MSNGIAVGISTSELSGLSAQLELGGKSAISSVYSTLSKQGFKYADWAKGVASGDTLTGVAANSYLQGTALMGLGQLACLNLPQNSIDKIKLNMAKAYVNDLMEKAKAQGNYVAKDLDFDIDFR